MFVAHYKHLIPSRREIASPFIAILVAVSFFAVLVPIVRASRDKSGVMACCVGKEAGHCDSGLTAHRPPPPPKPEPLCGLTPQNLDAITIVAEPTNSQTSQDSAESTSQAGADSQAGAQTKANAELKPRVESASLSRPCPMNCGVCTASTSRLQKRQKDVVQARTFYVSAFGSVTSFRELSRPFSSSESWTSIHLRGPPLS